MSRANSKRGYTRQNGGNTSHPVREYKSHTRNQTQVATYLEYNRSPFKNGGVVGK
jgi:hypothetical protein